MRKYLEFPYEIKQTNEGKYYGIIYSPDGKDISGKTDEYIVEFEAKKEAIEIIRKILDES